MTSVFQALDGLGLGTTYLLVVAATSAVVLLALFAIWLIPRPKKNAPPMVSCFPVFGGLMKFLKGPKVLMDEFYPKYGEVFTVPVLHRRFTFLLDPCVVPHFFTGRDDQVSQEEVYKFNVPTFGKGVVYDVPIPIRNEQFRILKDNLRTDMLKSYVSHMVNEATQYFDNHWKSSGEADISKVMADLIILTASRTLLGKEVRENLFEEVSKLLHDLDEGMVPLTVMFPYAPIAAHRKRDKARDELGRIFSKVIKQRLESGIQVNDMLGALITAHYRDGRALTAQEITGILIATLFGGQHTSSITSTWTGMELTANPQYLGRAIMEQKEMLKQCGKTIDYDALNKMDFLHNCVKEALRLHPPLILLMRHVHEPFDVTTRAGKTYTIPKGETILTSPTMMHRLPHIFTNPDTFDPDRHLGDKIPQWGLVNFGAGRHTCLGQPFAYLQVKAIWSVIIRNFDLEFAAKGFPQPNYNAMVIGADRPCIVKYRRRQLDPAL